jgi:hypothetical protein
LAGSEAEPSEGQRHCGDFSAIALPVKAVPFAVALPAERRKVAPRFGRLAEDRAYGLARNSGVDIRALGHHVHVFHS